MPVTILTMPLPFDAISRRRYLSREIIILGAFICCNTHILYRKTPIKREQRMLAHSAGREGFMQKAERIREEYFNDKDK